ncbi:Disease resistance protein L6 [Linum perenne]
MLVHFGEQATEDYEVFLSFRGSDVRKSFADYLYSYLVHSQIRTFRDEEELRKGETIAPSLVQAITESKIYIPILSERYASSKWCLQELAKMVECCRKGKGHIILPIFYFIDPRDVRHQAGVYEEAFEQHSKKHDPRIVQEWRTALLEVGQMKGWHVTENDSQGAVIADVFTTVELHLRSNYTLVTEELVGIDSHVQEVMRLLNLDIGDLKIVGIHGIGGMGKTTIAKAVYDSICTSFDRCCFLENIRELLLKNDGIMSLQNKFISSILRDDVRVKDASEGVRMIRDRVCKYKKVLVVLDDVDDTFEFDQILGKLGHFSSESRFIITTRDKIIDEENQFWMHDLLRDLGRAIVIEEDVRNPCKRSRIWSNEDAWNMLENVEGADQVEMLRIDMRCDRNLKFAAKTLEKLARLRYLDMTFFTLTGDFKGILPDISLRKLNICTEVIKVTNFGKSKKLQKLNLFGCKSVKELPDMSGLVNLDGLNLEGCTELVKVTSFGDMEMLRKLNMPGCKSMKELPDMSCLDNLRDLNLEGCTELNKVAGFGKLEKLRKLNLSGCKSIKELPDMSGLVSLDFLNLEGCTELVEVTSFVKLEKLRKLNMSGCMSIKELSDISGLKNLHDLNLEGCTGLIKVIGFEKLEKLRKLNLSGCRSIKELPNMSGLTSLDFLNLEGCTELIKVTSFEKLEMLQKLNMSGCMSIKELPDMSSLKSLHDLNLEGCTGLIKVTSFEKLEMLRKLNMSGCRSIKELPDMSGLVSLDDLNLVGCTELVKVASFKKLSMLRKLNMSGCRCIKELPDMSDLINLDDLTLVGCTELVKVKGFEKLSMLHKLNMSGCHSIKELPDMSGLKNLRDLNLEGCTQLANMCTSLNH